MGKGICGRSSVGAVRDCRNVCSQSEDADDANNKNEGDVVTVAVAGGGRISPPISIVEVVMASMATTIGRRV